ncbi:Uncharacterised protein [Chlamydia abortus]|nr:Uncharacterised protein [Chlamydia abortus]
MLSGIKQPGADKIKPIIVKKAPNGAFSKMNNPVLEEAFYANRNLYFHRINAVKNLKIPMW